MQINEVLFLLHTYSFTLEELNLLQCLSGIWKGELFTCRKKNSQKVIYSDAYTDLEKLLYIRYLTIQSLFIK